MMARIPILICSALEVQIYQNNVKDLSIGKCRSSGNRFSSAENRLPNVLQREKDFQSTSNSLFFERFREDSTFKFHGVPIKYFEQAREVAEHTKDT